MLVIKIKIKRTIWPNCRETENYYVKQREVDQWFGFGQSGAISLGGVEL